MTRSTQSRSRSRTRTRQSRSETGNFSSPRIRWVFGVIFVISLILTVFVLFMQRQWRHTGQRVVLLVHENEDPVRKPLTLAVLRLEEKEVTFLPIPAEQQIALEDNTVSYSSDALVGYTQLEERSWEYLQYILSLEYGLPIDGILWTGTAPGKVGVGELREVARDALWRRAPTTLTYWDRLQLWRGLFGVPAHQVETLDGISQLLNEDDVLNTSEYQRQYFSVLQDPAIRNSGWSIAILNGSGIQGYASRVAGALEMMGYEVRGVDTVDETLDSEVLLAPNEQTVFAEDIWAKYRLKDTFQHFAQSTDEEITRRRRSNAVIILGTDQAELWEKR